MHAQNGTDQRAGFAVGSRVLLKQLTAGIAALGLMSIVTIPFAKAQDMSNGADNFYNSDKVTVQKVTFKNQYQDRPIYSMTRDFEAMALYAGQGVE